LIGKGRGSFFGSPLPFFPIPPSQTRTMQRPTQAWSRYGHNSRPPAHRTYDEDEADHSTGWSPSAGAWLPPEACKVKDALFLGNVTAVQDSNFVVMNKIGFCVKCQTGFPVPHTLRRMGVTYKVMNLLGAFTDKELSPEAQDALLEKFFTMMEEAAEQGLGVLLYTFQDFAWPCFCVVAFWIRRHMWTVDHALAVMRSRQPLDPRP